MNLKTTLLLILLVGAGLGAWYWFEHRQPPEATSPTLTFLRDELKKDRLTRIEVLHGREPRLVLEKTGAEWSLPGKWPVRASEKDQWLDLLTTLGSRYAPLPPGDHPASTYGLGEDALVIKIKLDGKEHVLRFGEEPGSSKSFTRPTYLRLDDQKEIVRLGPGVLAALDRQQDYFQQRRLFPVERVAREEDSKEKIEQLAAKEIEVKAPTTSYDLVKKDDGWELEQPVHDHAEPAKVKTILTAVPDLWAERFIEKKDKKLDDFGLASPEYVLSITRASGAKVKLLIGKVDERKVRLVAKPAPPPPSPFAPPPKPQMEQVVEEYRFAKLEDNEQIFTVKGDKLPEIAVNLDTLRDPQVARFKSDDVRGIEIKQGDQTIALAREDGKWKLGKQDAEFGPVNDLLDKLSGLQAKDKEILDKADAKEVGLEPAQAAVTLKLEEGKDDKKKTRELVFRVGSKAKEADKIYVRVDGWPRVNQVNADLLKLVQRPALAYRSRRLLDLATSDLKKLEVTRPDEKYALERNDNTWKLAEPVKADVEAKQANELADDVTRLEAVELVADSPKEKDLDETYGLAKPALSVKLVYQDEKKPAQTLVVGKQRPGKQDYFARLDAGPVFAVKKEVHDHLERTSLSYRPLQLWELPTSDITEVTVQRDGGEYRLKRADRAWKIAGPFEATASIDTAEDLTDEVAKPKAERFEAHEAKDLARYGLDKPHLKIEVSAGKEKKTLEVGKTIDKDSKSRYARAGGGVVVLGEKALASLDRGALDLLDRDLLSLDTEKVRRIRVEGRAPFTLERKDKGWQVVDSPAPAFAPDEEALQGTLRTLERLRAAKYAAYGPKIDWKEFGLDKPAVKLTVDLDKNDKEAKGGEHVVELGKELPGGQRYARLDHKDAVAVLDAPAAKGLARAHLDFVDPRVLQYDLDAITGVRREMKDADLELAKKGDAWQIVKPTARRADDPTVNDVLEKTFRLRAARVAAYPAKDLKPFGLDTPTAVVSLELGKSKHVIKVGAKEKDSDERYAIIDQGDKVVVLPAELSRQLVAPPLHYADRTLAGLLAPDHAALQRGTRKTVFARTDGPWQMVEPVKSDAEDADLEDLVRSLQRLRADEVVADKGADLKKFGLDQPVAQWYFKSGDQPLLHLILGSPESGKDKASSRRYARLGGSDQVVLLSGKLSEKMLAEYRSRKPWTQSLDAAQVEQLKVSGAGKSFTLKKGEAGWSVVGESGAQVNVGTLTDTLDALAGLKAQHYVTDRKADLQLYGLQPPTWDITVQTPSGKRELWLGRTEGDSARFYATVPGNEGVFVLSEADSRRLARPLSAFVTSSNNTKGTP